MNNKINIIFWSGTGNTEAMAEAIYNGSNKSENSKLLTVDKATIDDVKEADVLFLGCPSMGVEELEESEMEPFMESISKLYYSDLMDGAMVNGCKTGSNE